MDNNWFLKAQADRFFIQERCKKYHFTEDENALIQNKIQILMSVATRVDTNLHIRNNPHPQRPWERHTYDTRAKKSISFYNETVKSLINLTDPVMHQPVEINFKDKPKIKSSSFSFKSALLNLFGNRKISPDAKSSLKENSNTDDDSQFSEKSNQGLKK